jgi:uncharacterized BrkB/YihY/UPF0761 family membrane protein
MTIEGLLVLIGVIVAACFIPVLIGLPISLYLKKNQPGNMFLERLQSGEMIILVPIVLSLIAGMVIYQNAPDTILGQFLHAPYGAIAAFVLLNLIAYLFGFLLGAARYLQERRKNDT